MKKQAINFLASSLTALSANAQITLTQATYIPLEAEANQGQNLSEFLVQGAELVAKTEPNTTLWFALKAENGNFAIVDFFPNAAARAEHFDGKVAEALKLNAKKLVAGGWEQGVLAKVRNFSVISYKMPTQQKATEATYILLQTQDGKGPALENLLTDAAEIVATTEPDTLLWTALKLDHNTYAIFDTFTDQHGRQAHFEGKVAGLLKAQSNELIVGGWEGVLSNVHHFEIIAEK